MRATRVGVSRQFARMIDAAEAAGITPPAGSQWYLQMGDRFTAWGVYWVRANGSLSLTPFTDALGHIGNTTGEAHSRLSIMAQTLEAANIAHAFGF